MEHFDDHGPTADGSAASCKGFGSLPGPFRQFRELSSGVLSWLCKLPVLSILGLTFSMS